MSAVTTPSQLSAVATDIMTVRYMTIANMCLVVYEYFISIEEEIRLIWPSKMSFAKAVFFWNRYLPFATVVLGTYLSVADTNLSDCKPIYVVAGSLCCTQFVLAEGILYMRAYAIWGRSKNVLCILLLIYTAVAASTYYTSVIFDTSSVVAGIISSGCLLTFPNKIDWATLVIILFSETFTICLLLIKGVSHFRHTRSAIVRTLYKDGVLYYVAVLAATVVNLVVLLTTSSSLCILLLNTQAIIHNILCNRLLLRLRGAYESISINTTIRGTFTWKGQVRAPERSFPLTQLSSSSA